MAATLVLAAGMAAAVTLPPQANDTAKTNVPSEPDVVAGQPEGVPPTGQPEGVPPTGQPESVPPAQSEHGQTVSGIAQNVEGCDDAQNLAEIASDGRLDRAELPIDPCSQGDEEVTSRGAGASANRGGGRSGPGGGGGGSGGPGGGSGGGGPTSGPIGAPTELPTPDELPTP